MNVVDFGKGTSAGDYWPKGTRKNLRFTITDQDNAGVPFDLTGRTLAFYIADSDNATALVTKGTGGSGITLSASAAGATAGVSDIAVVALTAADAAMRAKTYRYALWNLTGGQEEVLAKGDAVLSDSAAL